MADAAIDFTSNVPIDGASEPAWIHGAPGDPPLQIHRHDEHTFVLRQSKTLSYEGPFLFLLFGNRRALLLDTGDTADPESFPLARTVDGLVAAWLEAHPRDGYELVVAHTHGHGDHRRGDPQFVDKPDTVLVGTSPEEVQAFFGFSHWPEQVVQLDLGGRVLDVVGIPGHHEASIAIYDPWSGFLLTGDTVYPGRLYVEDYPTFVASLDRLVDFAAARNVTRVLGCHIEMSRTPRVDYPLGCRYQPDEPPLAMHPDRLVAVRDAARTSEKVGSHVFDDFVIWNRAQTRLVLTHLARRVQQRLPGRSTS
jgi:glyoxylase-like metal-dependent hydrolase (beta-lactamase superfamily II)